MQVRACMCSLYQQINVEIFSNNIQAIFIGVNDYRSVTAPLVGVQPFIVIASINHKIIHYHSMNARYYQIPTH